MTRKRLTRDKKWCFQYFPYHQMRMDNELLKGVVSLIQLTDGEWLYWDFPIAGKAAVAGKGMYWLQLIPDDAKRAITAKFLPDKKVSAWYVDVIDRMEYDDDGVAVFIDKYLDVLFTPQGDVSIADRDELEDAFKSGELTQEDFDSALAEGDSIVEELCTDISATEIWCRKILDCVLETVNQKRFVVFLDVDGVLDVFDSKKRIQELLAPAVERLSRFVKRMNASVVVISDWRLGSKEHCGNDSGGILREGWVYLEKTLKENGVDIFGVTPHDKALKSRTEEIKAYLQQHPEIYNYVIFDDCFSDDFSSDTAVHDHLVFVDALKGLQDEDILKACGIMNRCDLWI